MAETDELRKFVYSILQAVTAKTMTTGQAQKRLMRRCRKISKETYFASLPKFIALHLRTVSIRKRALR